jgi:hypothetical protein
MDESIVLSTKENNCPGGDTAFLLARRLFRILVGGFHSDEELVPLMMFARRTGASTRKGLVQKLDVRDQISLHPSPVGQSGAAGAANLISKELDRTVVNPVIVWFHNPFLVSVTKPKQAPLLNRGPK